MKVGLYALYGMLANVAVPSGGNPWVVVNTAKVAANLQPNKERITKLWTMEFLGTS